MLVMAMATSGCRHHERFDEDEWTQSGCIPDEWEEEHAPAERIRPSVIGWNAEVSRSLSRRMGEASVLVVAYDTQLRVLEDCQIAMPTRYVYRTLGESQVDEARLVSPEQLREKLPLATEIEATPGQTHRLSRSQVGSWLASGAPVSLESLEGHCDDATHLVTAAEVGAYELYRSDELVDRRGVFRACTATADPTPPEGCDSLLRLELSELAPRRTVLLAPTQTPLEAGPDPATMSEEEKVEYAKRLYVEGDEAFMSGDYEVALTKFETAYRVYVPNLHPFAINIAAAAFELGDCAKAKLAYQRFLDLVPDHPARAQAMERLLEIERSGCADGWR